MRNVRDIPCETFYNEVASIYSWRQVAERTERVYDYVAQKQVPNVLSRIKSGASWGTHIGIWALFYTIIEFFVLFVTEMLYPLTGIDQLKIFDKETYEVDPMKYGNHKIRLADYTKAYKKQSTTSDELNLVKIDVTSPKEEELVGEKLRRNRRYELI